MSRSDDESGTRPRNTRFAGVQLVLTGLVLVALVALIWRGAGSEPEPQTTTIMPSSDTLSQWNQHTITGSGSEPAHRLAVVGNELRINSSEANTDGNQRELWTLDGDHADVDVTVRIDRPSSLGSGFTPQPGIALRYHDDGDGSGRALIIDGNIWSRNFDRMIVGLWSWPKNSSAKVAIAAIGTPLPLQERVAGITGVTRNAGHPATDVFSIDQSSSPNSAFGFRKGDRVDVATAVDPGFDQKNAVITQVGSGGALIAVSHPGTTDASAFATEVGTIKFHYADGVDPRAFYPRYVRARIVGSTLQVKTWLVEQPEPGWQFTETIPAGLDVPRSGEVGLVANHLHGAGRYIAFGQVEVTKVTGP